MRWHCVRGTGSCYWYSYYGWTTRTANTTHLTTDVSAYNKLYLFEITVVTSRGRGLAYQLSVYIPPLDGTPKSFFCDAPKDSNTALECHWQPPTDVNPSGFYVSSNWLTEFGYHDFMQTKSRWTQPLEEGSDLCPKLARLNLKVC